MIEVQMAEQHDADTALFGQGELDPDRAGIQHYRVIDQKSATLLTDQPLRSIHETIRLVAPQHSYLHR